MTECKIENWILLKKTESLSTNDDALGFIHTDLSSKYIFSAKKQISGRGRLGRSWKNGHNNLAFSLLFNYPQQNMGILAVLCGVCILKTIKHFASASDVSLKWPNDVMINNKKVSGILIERKDENFVVVGIGVNIHSCPKINDSSYEATCLKYENINVKCADFLKMFVKIFDMEITKIYHKEFADIKNDWNKYAKGIYKQVKVTNLGKIEQGIFQGINEDGIFLLKNKEGIIENIIAGDVEYCNE